MQLWSSRPYVNFFISHKFSRKKLVFELTNYWIEHFWYCLYPQDQKQIFMTGLNCAWWRNSYPLGHLEATVHPFLEKQILFLSLGVKSSMSLISLVAVCTYATWFITWIFLFSEVFIHRITFDLPLVYMIEALKI